MVRVEEILEELRQLEEKELSGIKTLGMLLKHIGRIQNLKNRINKMREREIHKQFLSNLSENRGNQNEG